MMNGWLAIRLGATSLHPPQIAPETVKSHAKHILLKLAAQTRVEAVSRAHSLGII
jgi:ATP/maltotriose-dependent transcriptional regulator MalT